MKEKYLHIIAFDVPFPADYGGVIDIYYKIKTLHSLGVKIILHCFEYGRSEASQLENYCEKVYYYKRKMNKKYLFNSLPYVVVTRSSERLMENLLQDDYPILFEGLHCCFYLNDIRLKGRNRIVRTHNIEHDYYKNLAKVEDSLFRKIYFNLEAKKLKRFEKSLKHATHIAAISPADAYQLTDRYLNVEHVTAFHPNEKVKIKDGLGQFCLYHGNLEVGENNEAAMYLVNEVFAKMNIPLIIAGRKPTAELVSAIKKHKHIELKANISTLEIDELIADAQINILPTFQATGIKLKLLAALFNGRHCLVNSPMVINTGLEELCVIKNSAHEMAIEIHGLFRLPFQTTEIKKRENILSHHFSNIETAKKLIAMLS